MKNRKIWVGLAALAVAASLLLGIWFVARPEGAEGEKTYSVSVVHKDGSRKDFTYHTDEMYLGDALLAEGLIAGTEDQYGLMVTTVDGETADWNVDQGWWALWIGEEMAVTGVSATVINDGDSFSWVYTIGY